MSTSDCPCGEVVRFEQLELILHIETWDYAIFARSKPYQITLLYDAHDSFNTSCQVIQILEDVH